MQNRRFSSGATSSYPERPDGRIRRTAIGGYGFYYSVVSQESNPLYKARGCVLEELQEVITLLVAVWCAARNRQAYKEPGLLTVWFHNENGRSAFTSAR